MWNPMMIKPQYGQTIIAVAEGIAVVGRYMGQNYGYWEGRKATPKRLIETDNGEKYRYDDFYIWTPYPISKNEYLLDREFIILG